MAGAPLPTYQLIDISALVLLAFIIASVLIRVRAGKLDLPRPSKELLGKVGAVLVLDVGISRPLRTCNTTKWASHLLVFWGFVSLMVATTLAFLMKPEGAVLPLTNPVKVFGNVGGVMVIGGFVGMFFIRFKESGSPWHINKTDLFLIFLFLAAFSGFGIETTIYSVGREAEVSAAVYYAHMIFVTLLLATAPYTKFVHAIYKPSWLLQVRSEDAAPMVKGPLQMPVREVES